MTLIPIIAGMRADRLRMVLALSPGECGAADCLSRIAARIEQDQAGFSPGEIRDAARFLRAYAGHPDPVDTLVETDWERLVGAGLAGGYAGPAWSR